MTSPSNNRLGIGLMCLGILMFALNDVMGKWLMSTYTVGQVLLLRSAAAVLILLPFALKEGLGSIWNAPRPGLQVARVAFGTLETACFYWAVASLPLVSVMTFYLSSAALCGGHRALSAEGAAGAGPVARRHPRLRRRPLRAAALARDADAARPHRHRGQHALRGPDALHPPAQGNLRHLSLIVWQTVGALLFGALLSPFSWVQPTWRDFGLLSLLGVVAMCAHVMVAQALRLAPAAVVSPFNYTLIVWAAVFGWLFFGEWPTPMMMIGAVVIVAAGLYLLWREGRPQPILTDDPP